MGDWAVDEKLGHRALLLQGASATGVSDCNAELQAGLCKIEHRKEAECANLCRRVGLLTLYPRAPQAPQDAAGRYTARPSFSQVAKPNDRPHVNLMRAATRNWTAPKQRPAKKLRQHLSISASWSLPPVGVGRPGGLGLRKWPV